jgi:lysozyme family protein
MQDGEIGPITIAAVNKLPLNDILLRYDAYRLFFYSNLPEKQWIKYSRGWVRRVAKNLLFGADDN